jgi:hypothetical protein
MWQTAVTFIVALWLIGKGFTNPDSPGVLLTAGVIAATFGFYIAAVEHRWQAFTIGMIGVWLFCSPIAFHFTTTWNFVIFGTATAVFAIWVMRLHQPSDHIPAGWE